MNWIKSDSEKSTWLLIWICSIPGKAAWAMSWIGSILGKAVWLMIWISLRISCDQLLEFKWSWIVPKFANSKMWATLQYKIIKKKVADETRTPAANALLSLWWPCVWLIKMTLSWLIATLQGWRKQSKLVQRRSRSMERSASVMILVLLTTWLNLLMFSSSVPLVTMPTCAAWQYKTMSKLSLGVKFAARLARAISVAHEWVILSASCTVTPSRTTLRHLMGSKVPPAGVQDVSHNVTTEQAGAH